MNKKANTIFFILGATLFNILITVSAIFLLLAVYANLLMHRVPESSQIWFILIIFIASVAISYVVYRSVINFLIKKINMEQYFDPIFGGRRWHS